MAFSQGPATPGRKARRSWFDTPPLTHLDPPPVSGQQVSKRRSLDMVETLTLTHFTNPPRITFGKAIIGKTKHRTLLLRNPHDFEQEVIVERFPYKKKFMVNQTRFTVGPESTCSLEITWAPEEAGGYREMVQFYVNEVYRLQAFLIGTADKPKPPRKIRKYPLGPCVRNPPTVVQTPALSSIKTSYSPTSRQVANELMEDMQSNHQCRMEDKENSESKRRDSHEAREIQEGGVLKLSKVSPVNEKVIASAALNPVKMQTKLSTEDDCLKTPTPLESTTIVGKQETGRECLKNRRQWRNISDITSPTLNMSPIPVNDEAEHGMTVDSFFQPNETCNQALTKADRLSELGRGKNVKSNIIQRMPPKDTGKDLKDTFVIPLAPAKSTKVAHKLKAAEDNIFLVSGSVAAVSTVQQQIVQADETRIIKANETLLKGSCSVGNSLGLSEQLSSDPVDSNAESSTNLNRNHLDANKNSDVSPPKIPRNAALFDPSQISPRTLLDESLTLISQGKLPLRSMTDSPDDICPSINSSLISQGQGIISPNSFMEDMRSMMQNSHCGIGNEPKNTSTPNIPSPSMILNSSIPHNVMVNHLESVRLSLHDSPVAVSGEYGTPRKLQKTFMHKRKSITSQFQKEEKKRIATAAQVIKKDQQLMGDSNKQFTNKYNVSKKHALTKSIGIPHNLYATGSPKRETFILKKKEIEGKKAAMRSPLGKKSVKRSPKRRSPLSSPQEFGLKSVKNKKGRRKSSPRKPFGRTSQVKKSPTRNSDPIMPKIMSRIRANMMMTGDTVWNLATPQKDLKLLGPCAVNPCKSVDQSEDWKPWENNGEASYFTNLPPAESKTTDEIISENTLIKKTKLFPDLHESACYGNDEECLLVKDNKIKVISSNIDRNTEDATDIEKRSERETICKTQLEHKHCISKIDTSVNNVAKTHSTCQLERVVTETERNLSAQRFDTLSPNNLPTSPEGYLDLSRRGTITVTKSRPSDALLTAMNNRKRLFQDSPQRTPYSITDDDKETLENISVKFEEHYQEIDGKIYVIVKETTDVVKSTTETYVEEISTSPQQFATPVRLPNSPDLLVSRRSTHIVRSPKVINSDSMYGRQLDFADEVEDNIVDNDETKNLANEKALRTDKKLNNSELSEDNCSAIKSDTFEKEPSLLITADTRDIFIDISAPAITSVCTISRRLVSYDDGSETCSTANVTKDSLDISHSTDSLGCSFNEAHASSKAKKPFDRKQIDKEDMAFAIDSEESTIQLNWEVLAKDEHDVNIMFESDQEYYRECKNFSRRDYRHAAADEDSEDEKFYDTLSENYYDAMSDAGNPEVELLDELTISSKYLESITAESGKHPAVVANSGFGKYGAHFSEVEERQECSVLSGRLLAEPHTDTCVQLTEANTTVPVNLDEQAVRTEVSIDHIELFELIERKIICLSSAAELQLVDEVVRSTPEAKAKRKLRRSASASDLLEHSCDLLENSCDLLENQHVLDEAEPQVLSVPKVATPGKLMAPSKSAVFRNYAGQVLTKYSPKNVSNGQPPCSKTTQVMATRRSQSMMNLARQAERVRPVRTEQHTTISRITRQASHVTQSASKQKITKGVAQSKLFLVKKSKTATPRHPMLYAAKNMYYDERWMEKQERGFVQWLNFVLTPPDEYVAVANKAKVDARSLSLDVDHVTPRLAPTKEILSFRAYAARRRLNRLRRGACELYQSDAFVGVIRKIEVEVESRRISARRDKMIHADVGIKQKLLDLLLHYSPLWLRIGLETIFGEVLMLQSNQDVMGLSRFILTRLLASPDIAAEFAHPTVPHLYKEGYVDSVSRHTVKKFLLLVYFLDQAKLGHLIDHDPCLFCKDAGIKSSKEVLIEFSREVLSGEGDITRHLAYLGYTVSHSQKPIDEFDFAVTNLSSDLRDGLRLCRVLEFLAGDHNIMAKLRTPAISRLQKIHNTELFFKALHDQGLDFNLVPGTVTARDVVDGHREKTLSLLWQLIIHFQSSVLVNETHLKEEIDILMKSLRLKIAMQKIGALSMEDCQARRDSGETKLLMENHRLQLIFQWCRLVCLHYGLKIENFTVSFSDGRALCCLLHHYHPALLPLVEIRFETTISAQESEQDQYQRDIEDSVDGGTVGCAPDEDNPEVFERLLANEKSNYKTLYEKTSALGGVPLMLKSADMSNTIPDEKVVSTFVSYLCARLLDIREEVRAARIMQMAWRKKQLRKQFLERQRRTKAAITIQHWFRSMLVKRQKVREMEAQAAVHIQAAWRSLTARLYVGRLKQMIQEGEKKDHNELSNVTSKFQRHWQPQLIEHYHMILLKQQKQQEHIWRRAEEAAITIQKHVRRFQCRQEFIRQQASVIKIQTLWRRHLAKKILCTLKNERRENSAVVIQKWMKRHFWLSQYRKKRNAVISLQKCWRMRQGRRTLQSLRTEKYFRAATTIQKHVRARLVQKTFQKIKQAVVVVQCHWRMKQAKRKLEILRAERETKAAILLQNYMKSIICRQKYIRLRNATILLQRNWKQIIAQRKLVALKSERDNEAAVVIQKYYKRYKVQCQFHDQQKSAILIQSLWRMLQAKKQLLALQQKKQEQYNKAAIVIHKNFKRYKAQQQFRAQQKSAILIQSMWRVIQAKRELLSLKQKKQEQYNKAAIVIQTNFKRYKAQQQFRAQQKSAILIQSMWRMLQAKREFLSLKQKNHERSATLIQSYFRRCRCKQEFQQYRNAAITIQKTWRMHCAKNVLRKLQLENQIQAAIKIQRTYRGFIQRRRYLQLKLSAVILQKWWIMVLTKKLSDRLKYQQQEHAALVLQRNFKMWKHRNYFLKLKSSAVVLQTTWKMIRARRLFLTLRSVKQERSALCIQKVWRGYLARKMLASKRRSASVIQSWWRMSQVKQQYCRMKEATLLIQSWWRMSQAKEQYCLMKEATLLIQAWYRAAVVSKHQQSVFFNQRTAAIHIQSWWRGIVIRQKLQTMKHSALIIQSHYRCFQCRRSFLSVKEATVVIQNHYRSYIRGREVRKEYLTLKRATVTIQRRFRTYLQKRNGKQKAAALVLQTVFRKIRARRKYSEQKQAAQTIQKYFRGYQKTRAIRQQFLQQKQAASIIQRTYRDFVIRRKYLHIRQSIIKIQAHVKGRIARKQFQELKHAAVTIQVHFRAVRLSQINRNAFLQFRASAIIIQRFYRSAMVERRALEDVARQQSAATKVQAAYRGWSQRNKYLLLQAATVMIQRWYRSYLAGKAVRTEIMWMRQAACVIQKRFRLYKQVQDVKRQILELRADKQREITRKLEEDKCDNKREVSMTNSVVERRTEETRREHAAIVIQKVFRGYQTRIRCIEELAKSNDAARVIQNRWREVSDRRRCQKEFVAKREAAVVIQTYFRMKSQRQCHQENIRLVVALQACIRTFIQRHRYQESIKQVIKLQKRVRSLQQMRKNRKQFLKLPHGAVTDQTYGPSELTQRPDYPVESVLIIQSNCEVQQQLDASSKDFEASETEKEFMEVKQQELDKETTLTALSLCQTYLSCKDVARHLAAKDFEASDAEKECMDVKQLDKETTLTTQSLCQTYPHCEDVTRHFAAKDFEVSDAEKEFMEVQQLDKETLASQSLCHTYPNCEDMTRHLAAKDCEASDAEKEFMEVQLLNKETLTSQSLCQTYPSCEDMTIHLAPIDICTGQQFKERYHQKLNASAIVIQRAVKRYICRRKMIKIQCIVMIQANIRQFLCRCQFLAKLQSVMLLQAVVRGWVARRSTAELRKRHKATICLQAHLRGYLVRKAYSTLLQEKMQSVWRQKKEHGAAITIQARWRGFATRKNTKDRKLTQVRKRLKEANRQATEEKTLGSRTSSALDFLLRERDVGHILEALMHLEVCTRLSPICCERLVEVNAVPGLYRLMASCNRSVPHMELIKYSVNILLNLAKYEKTTAAVLEPQDSVATILELVQIYREKGAIFNYCCMLLGILGLHPDRRAIILKHPLIVDRFQSIHALSLRKHRLNRNRQVTQAKMAALRSFNCTLPVLTPSKCKLRRIRPEWALAGDTIKDFDDPVTAVTFVMDALQIGPKM